MMQAQGDQWLDSFDTSSTPPLEEGWDKHPFWADQETLANPESEAAQLVEELQNECTPEERAESLKVCSQAAASL